ncbi:DUF6630 family protein [Deinococcus sp.]|uniref:DUF6630 family protein n=1 Tax=Deinococcus sp. TaxID=47478 RepID=UPI003CC5E85D
MDELLALILEPLDAERMAEIAGRVRRGRQEALEGEELDALRAALQDAPDEYADGWWLDPARSRFWLCLCVDWKASDEVEWQVQGMARTLGLPGGFRSVAMSQPGSQTPDVLREAATWMQGGGFDLLGLETGSDAYMALPIRLDSLERARQEAERLGLDAPLS